MEYEVLTKEEQDEIIVGFLLAQERDKFCHSLNLARYEQILSTIPEGPWRQRITQLRDETNQRLTEVRSIIAATKGQLPPADRVAKARENLKAKEQVKS